MERIESKPVVLCVDDEEAILRSLRRLLRREPYELLTTCEPDEALDWVRERHVSVVIADQRMPSMNGTELLKSVRLQSPATGRAMLTAYPGLDAVAEEENESIERLIAKPWNDEELRRAIRRMIGERLDPPGRRPRDFRELVVPLDCRKRTGRELLSRIERALRVPWTAFSGVAVLLENLWALRDSVGEFVEGLASLVGETGVRTFVVDRSAYAATFLEITESGPLLSAYPPAAKVVETRRALVVSDREDTIEFFRAVLHSVRHEVATVRSGAEATLRLDEERFDVVFVDLDVPDADVERIEDRARLARIVALSNTRPSAGLWIGKPFGAREILEAAQKPD